MFVIFPNQLFYEEAKKVLDTHSKVLLVEEPIYFYDKRYRNIRPNKIKLAYMVACMKSFYNKFKSLGYSNISYVSYNDVSKYLKEDSHFTSWNPYDFDVVKKYKNITILDDSPYFLMQPEILDGFHAKHGIKNNISHATFYTFVKSHLQILQGQPSYDSENRNKIPASMSIPNINEHVVTKFVSEACTYINNHTVFKNHVGTADPKVLSLYPITPDDALKALKDFCSKRFANFGKYQDAIKAEKVFLFHSNLSAAINIGIITPRNIVKYILSYCKEHQIPINSLEGYVRQLIGWREYCRYIYMYHYKELINSNQFEAKRNNTKKWYDGTTDIPPLDQEIKKAIKYGYAHHIVRLMVFLNSMVLSELSPEQIYKWFMEVVAIDSYDWVMRSNIQMMSYYWPRAMRKPYISSSAYIVRMSDYQPDNITKWQDVWDALFYHFLSRHKHQLKGSASIYLRNLSYYEKIPREKQIYFDELASKYLNS